LSLAVLLDVPYDWLLFGEGEIAKAKKKAATVRAKINKERSHVSKI
jgi:hypothetical protein